WGVDALLEQQTREHDDLDVVVELSEVQRLTEALVGAGYEQVAGEAPKSFVLVDPQGRQVDVHPVVFNRDRGGGVYQMDDGREWVYPVSGFDGRGEVARRPVRCLSAEVQVLVHDGYELTDKDYRELYLLHKRFGAELPPRYAERALATGQASAGPARQSAPSPPIRLACWPGRSEPSPSTISPPGVTVTTTSAARASSRLGATPAPTSSAAAAAREASTSQSTTSRPRARNVRAAARPLTPAP